MKKQLATILLLIILSSNLLQAQYAYITGKVYDKFGPVSNVSITIKGTPYGTYSDTEGYFAFEIDTGYHQLAVEISGYQKVEKAVLLYNLDQKELNFELENSLMDADVTTGSKSHVTQNQLESPVPIDVIKGEELVNTGQTELSQALHQLLPSFYSVKQSVDDPINLVDPISLRGLGPDQVLVLVNGKRRHKSALLNTSDIFGKGTAGTDLNTIPVLAVDKIEILRDGASSQYGSDAIAGVINIVLKSRAVDPSISVMLGETSEDDGNTKNISFNYGLNLRRRGFLTLTGSFTDQEQVNRGGDFTGQVYNRNVSEARLDSFYSQTGFPERRLFELGSSAYQGASLIFNSAFELSDKIDFYSFGGISYKDGRVNLAYRIPADERLVVASLYPNGFAPELQTEVFDRTWTSGIKGDVNGWFLDFSYARARNIFDITVANSNNASLSFRSPTTAFAGAYKYFHDIIAFDATKTFDLGNGQMDIAFGTEYKIEEYVLLDGEPESYINGGDTTALGIPKDAGIQGYKGIDAEDALEELRSNISVYGEVEYSVGKLLTQAAVRLENYSDFGENINYKIASRYKFFNQLLLRGSYSTGFKAPSLHQLFYQRVSTQFVDNSIQNVILFNTESPIFRSRLGLLGLEPELSKSISIGITSSLSRNVSLSIDAYQTDIDDRIGLISRIDVTQQNALRAISNDLGIRFIEFFTNTVDTRTTGLDAVLAAQYNSDHVSLKFNSGFSVMQTRLRDDVPLLGGMDGPELINRAEVARIETYVPSTQWRNSLTVTIQKIIFTLNHTRYGSTEFRSPIETTVLNELTGTNESLDQVFSAKHIFGADLKIRPYPKLEVTLGALNLTNEYPDQLTHSANRTLGLTPYSPSVRAFDLRGTYVYLRTSFTF